MGFTITRNTTTGKQEILTDKGFRTRERIAQTPNEFKIQYFDKIEGSKKVKELKDDCRISQIRKSIILNYS